MSMPRHSRLRLTGVSAAVPGGRHARGAVVV